MPKRLLFFSAVSLLCLSVGAAAGTPWLDPGDVRARSDVQLLADAGLLTGPTMSWPIAWAQFLRELDALDTGTLPPAQAAAATRLRQQAARETRSDTTGVEVSVAAAANPEALRRFGYVPREEVEAGVAVSHVGERFAWRLTGTVVGSPDDDQSLRPDGSYVGVSLGNWMITAGFLERWWGPGWDGSLILSTNARPVPAIAIDRNESTPFDVPVLRWLGPWRLTTFMGQLEDDRDFSDTLLFGLRGEIRPLRSLQLGVSRTAQWCGDTRPCGLDTFWDLLSGNDNDQPLAEQPGNQLAGFDVRWAWPGGGVPVAVYAQAIGEDEAGFMPSKYLGLFGAETWFDIGGGSLRAHVEYADTACDFLNSDPQFGCGYTNNVYTSGYRFRGRALGHSIDADGQSLTFGGVYLDSRGSRWEVLARDADLNREGAADGHSLADASTRVRELRASHGRAYSWGNIVLSVGYSDIESDGATTLEDGASGYLTWRHHVR